MNSTKKKFRFPFVILLLAGIITAVVCAFNFVPVWAAQTMCDLMPEAAEKVDGVCTVVDYHDDNTVTVTAQYDYGYYTYENVFEDVTLGSDRAPLSVGDTITLYIFDDNVFFYDAINNNIENGKRSNEMFMFGAGIFVGVVLVIFGIIGMVLNSKAKKQEMLEARQSSYNNPYNGYYGGMQTYGSDPSYGSSPSYGSDPQSNYGQGQTYGSDYQITYGQDQTYGSAPQTPYGQDQTYGSAPQTPYGQDQTYGSAPQTPYGQGQTYGSAPQTPYGQDQTYGSDYQITYGQDQTYGSAPQTPYGQDQFYGTDGQ